MGYQENWFYMEPQRKFDKLIRAYERAESAGYYRVAGAEPCSVVILKQPFGDVPAGSKVLWVCGDRGFHSVGGVFGDALALSGENPRDPGRGGAGTGGCSVGGHRSGQRRAHGK